MDFLFEDLEDFGDRLMTVSLRKNIALDGFGGYYGLRRTYNGFFDVYYMPVYMKVIEDFYSIVDLKDAPKILEKLRTEYSADLIHTSLIEWLTHDNYPDKATKKLIEELFILLHEYENLPSCGRSRCSWYWRENYSSSSSIQKKQEQS